MKFPKILQAFIDHDFLAVGAEEKFSVLIENAKAELVRIKGSVSTSEDPLTVFERWSLPPNRGVKHELESSKSLRYGDIHLNAAHIGFMQCYTWLAPQIENLQAKVELFKNTSNVISNDKTETFPQTVGFIDPTVNGDHLSDNENSKTYNWAFGGRSEFWGEELVRETTEHIDHEDDGQPGIKEELLKFSMKLMSNGDSVTIYNERYTMVNGELVKSDPNPMTFRIAPFRLGKTFLQMYAEINAQRKPKVAVVAYNPDTHCVVPRAVHDAMNEFLKKVGAI